MKNKWLHPIPDFFIETPYIDIILHHIEINNVVNVYGSEGVGKSAILKLVAHKSLDTFDNVIYYTYGNTIYDLYNLIFKHAIPNLYVKNVITKDDYFYSAPDHNILFSLLTKQTKTLLIIDAKEPIDVNNEAWLTLLELFEHTESTLVLVSRDAWDKLENRLEVSYLDKIYLSDLIFKCSNSGPYFRCTAKEAKKLVKYIETMGQARAMGCYMNIGYTGADMLEDLEKDKNKMLDYIMSDFVGDIHY